MDWQRKQKQPIHQLSDAGSVVAQRTSDSSSYSVRRTLFEEAIAYLKPKVRGATWSCFELHGLQGRIAEDVASELGVSVNSVYVNTSRVMAQLREYCSRKAT